ncbi:hypothetical protein D3C80_1727620 [compost metagenome]
MTPSMRTQHQPPEASNLRKYLYQMHRILNTEQVGYCASQSAVSVVDCDKSSAQSMLLTHNWSRRESQELRQCF